MALSNGVGIFDGTYRGRASGQPMRRVAWLFALVLSCGTSNGVQRHDAAADDLTGSGSGGANGTGGVASGGGGGGGVATTGGASGSGGAGICGGKSCDTGQRCCVSASCSACVPGGQACTTLICGADGGYDAYPGDCARSVSGDSAFCSGQIGRHSAYRCDSSVLSDPCVNVPAPVIGLMFCCP